MTAEAKQWTVGGTGASLEALLPPPGEGRHGDSFQPPPAPGPTRPIRHGHSRARVPEGWRDRWQLSEAEDSGRRLSRGLPPHPCDCPPGMPGPWRGCWAPRSSESRAGQGPFILMACEDHKARPVTHREDQGSPGEGPVQGRGQRAGVSPAPPGSSEPRDRERARAWSPQGTGRWRLMTRSEDRGE